MCGLAGILRLDGRPAGDGERRRVDRMLDRIAHRGPDDRGVACEGPVCLGSVRLAILDLSPAGHMPMRGAGDRALLAYNGEVYDHGTLRRELTAEGVVFRSHTDTEVVLEAMVRHGEAILHRFIGMFAFALYRADRGELLLVRDRYGVKPLYWAVVGRRLVFASELKALLAELPRREADRAALAEWWLYRNLDGLGTRTPVVGIRQLPAGHLLRVGRDGTPRLSRWYDPLAAVDAERHRTLARTPVRVVVEEVARLLADSIRLRLVADVPVGVLLSGGLDSSLVTLLAARVQRDLTAFHVSVPAGRGFDERPYAETVARTAGIPLVVRELDPSVFRRGLPRVAWLEDLPITHPNSVAYHEIARTARAHGVVVLLSGEGADELFGGYAWSQRRRRRLVRLAPLFRRLPPRLRDALTLFVYGMDGLPVTAHRFREALPAAVTALDRGLRAELEARAEAAFRFVTDAGERAVMAGTACDLVDFLAPLLRRLDRTTMGASVECREPFLDPRLVHLALALPAEWKVGRRADKWVLKRIAEPLLPRAHVHRPKMGFPLPLADYLAPLADGRALAGGFVAETLGLARAAIRRVLDELPRRTHGPFGLLALELWGRIHLAGEDPEAVGVRLGLLEGTGAETSAAAVAGGVG